MFDIDYFKQVNDRHGHSAGDAVLRHFAGLLTATFRQVDLPARIGGEEFAVLLPSTPLEAAEEAANRLRLAMSDNAVDIDGVQIACTVSGGVASMNGETAEVNALLKRADQALYAAKAAGRNQVHRLE
jgi:diguanylate cyclase (GGDEF)-like protein